MTFSEFAKMMYPLIGKELSTSTFVLCLTDHIMHPSCPEDEKRNEDEDSFNPLSNNKISMLQKIYNGSRKISAAHAKIIISHLDKGKFIDYLSSFPDDTIDLIASSLQEKKIKFNNNEAIDECANLFASILYDCASQNKTRDKRTLLEKNIGMPRNCTIPLAGFLQLQRNQEMWTHLSKQKKDK